jgi:hypothetical protein
LTIGVILPGVHLGPASIALAAPLVGSTFMVATMIGMQEARTQALGNPTALLGLIAAAFVIGQLAAPSSPASSTRCQQGTAPSAVPYSSPGPRRC